MSNRPAFLVAYATREGQARKIADEIVVVGTEMGVHMVEEHIGQLGDDVAEGYAGVIVGASIHMGRFEKEALQWIKEHKTELEAAKASFFGVCLTAAKEDEEALVEMTSYLDRLRDETGWHPEMMTMFAGALPYTTFGFIKRLLVKQLGKAAGMGTDTHKDYEYTDWSSVDGFADCAISHAIGREFEPQLRAG
jgi:menaquinone-dependent protoporphyrinogen oxidase